MVMRKWERVFRAGKTLVQFRQVIFLKSGDLSLGQVDFNFFFLPWSFLGLVTDIAVEYNKKEVPVQQLMFEKRSFCILVNQYFQLFLLLDIQNE